MDVQKKMVIKCTGDGQDIANIKELLEHIAKKNKTKSQELLKICEKQLTIAGNRGILKKKKISRKISSLNSKIKAI